MNECVFINRTYHIMSHGGLQLYLTVILRGRDGYELIYITNDELVIISSYLASLLMSDIERQLVKAPLAAAISLFLISLTHPAHA